MGYFWVIWIEPRILVTRIMISFTGQRYVQMQQDRAADFGNADHDRLEKRIRVTKIRGS